MTAESENTSSLTQEEIAALPERAQLYIRQLEDKLAELEYSYRSTKDRLRKANWANWNRKG